MYCTRFVCLEKKTAHSALFISCGGYGDLSRKQAANLVRFRTGHLALEQLSKPTQHHRRCGMRLRTRIPNRKALPPTVQEI